MIQQIPVLLSSGRSTEEVVRIHLQLPSDRDVASQNRWEEPKAYSIRMPCAVRSWAFRITHASKGKSGVNQAISHVVQGHQVVGKRAQKVLPSLQYSTG